MITEVVPPALAGERIDRVVALLADCSRSQAAAIIEAGGVRVDAETVTSGKIRLVEGQAVEVDPLVISEPGPPVADPDVVFDVVYEDDHILIINKPAGLVVHPGSGNADGTLVNGLLARYPEIVSVGERIRPGIVHRLDAGSSGLLVVARTQAAADALIEQFASHHATRVYLALVWGHPDAPHGVIDAPIGRSKRDPLKMAIVADGRRSRTEYRVLEKFDSPADLALLECRLETGRTHQIRVHLGSIDHPLVGDPVYGQRRPKLQLTRPFLHAAELAFDHPMTGELVTFKSELASDLAERLSTLKRFRTD